MSAATTGAMNRKRSATERKMTVSTSADAESARRQLAEFDAAAKVAPVVASQRRAESIDGELDRLRRTARHQLYGWDPLLSRFRLANPVDVAAPELLVASSDAVTAAVTPPMQVSLFAPTPPTPVSLFAPTPPTTLPAFLPPNSASAVPLPWSLRPPPLSPSPNVALPQSLQSFLPTSPASATSETLETLVRTPGSEIEASTFAPPLTFSVPPPPPPPPPPMNPHQNLQRAIPTLPMPDRVWRPPTQGASPEPSQGLGLSPANPPTQTPTQTPTREPTVVIAPTTASRPDPPQENDSRKSVAIPSLVAAPQAVSSFPPRPPTSTPVPLSEPISRRPLWDPFGFLSRQPMPLVTAPAPEPAPAHAPASAPVPTTSSTRAVRSSVTITDGDAPDSDDDACDRAKEATVAAVASSSSSPSSATADAAIRPLNSPRFSPVPSSASISSSNRARDRARRRPANRTLERDDYGADGDDDGDPTVLGRGYCCGGGGGGGGTERGDADDSRSRPLGAVGRYRHPADGRWTPTTPSPPASPVGSADDDADDDDDGGGGDDEKDDTTVTREKVGAEDAVAKRRRR